LMPLSVIFTLVLISQGVVQNFKPYQTVALLEGTSYDNPIKDKDGNNVMEEVKDANGKVLLEPGKDEKGNPLLDERGQPKMQPKMQQKTEHKDVKELKVPMGPA